MSINRVAGDNYPIIAEITINGESIDIAGSVVTFNFIPIEGDGSKKTLIGEATINIGEVKFSPISSDMIEGRYLFDIKREINGEITTHLTDTMLLTKNIE